MECRTFNPRRGTVPKKAYSQAEAITTMRKMEVDLPGLTFSAYRCSACPHWHVGKERARRVKHRDDPRLLEVGPRAMRAEQEENETPQRRRIGVIRGRVFHAQALAAGKTNHFQARKPKSEAVRFANLMQANGWYEWEA